MKPTTPATHEILSALRNAEVIIAALAVDPRSRYTIEAVSMINNPLTALQGLIKRLERSAYEYEKT